MSGHSRVPLAVVWIFALAGAASVTFAAWIALDGTRQLQEFAANGLAKRVLVPAFFGALWVVALAAARVRRGQSEIPLWWWTLLLGAAISTAGSVLGISDSTGLANLAQSFFLIASALVFFILGLWTREWTAGAIRAMFLVLVGVSVSSLVLGTTSVVPFVGVVVPTALSLVYLGIRARNPWLSLAGLILIAWQIANIVSSQQEVSIALAAQFMACGATLALALAPRLLRPALAAVAAVAVLTAAAFNSWIGMFFGATAYDDVTLAQRGFETLRVWSESTQAGVFRIVFGAGPAGTVDLTNAPDAATLVAAGRTIAAVDDTHLLSTWLLMKLGLTGIAVLVLLLIRIFRLTTRVLSSRAPRPFDVALTMYVVGGVALAIPAATNLFIAPTVFLALGVLEGRLQLETDTARAEATEVRGHPVHSARRVPAIREGHWRQ